MGIEEGETDHSVQRACFFQNLVDGGLDRFFLGYICLDGEELAWVLGGDGGEVVVWSADVDGVDSGGAVGETAVCYSQSDA
jgi:hypothetical protein